MTRATRPPPPRRLIRPNSKFAPVEVSRHLLQALLAAGTAPEVLVRAVGLPVPIGQIVNGEVELLPREMVARLNQACIFALERNARRGAPTRSMNHEEFEFMCYALLSCGNLREALRCAQEFFDALNGRAGKLDVVVSDVTEIRVDIWRSSDTRSSFLMDICGFRSLHSLFSWLIGEQIEVIEASVKQSRPPDEGLVADIFPYPIWYEAAWNGMKIPTAFLERPVIRSRQELKDLLVFFPFELHFPAANSIALSEHVRVLCRTALLKSTEMPNLDFLSRTFRQSRATFCRRLKEEGASLQAIKQHCRLELATDYLLNTKMTNAEVADRLGFSCAKAFAAAFKKWNGSPPAEFRAREQSRGDPRGM